MTLELCFHGGISCRYYGKGSAGRSMEHLNRKLGLSHPTPPRCELQTFLRLPPSPCQVSITQHWTLPSQVSASAEQNPGSAPGLYSQTTVQFLPRLLREINCSSHDGVYGCSSPCLHSRSGEWGEWHKCTFNPIPFMKKKKKKKLKANVCPI